MHFLIEQEDTEDYVLFSDYKGFVTVYLNGCSVELSKAAVEDLVRYLHNGETHLQSFEADTNKCIDGTVSWSDNSFGISMHSGGASLINLTDEEMEIILCKLVDWLILG